MKPIKLEMIGFKSFFHHTIINFKDGITCIVGPNGCGKSNIVDAIRWVLGEQAPSRIRGKGMDSVIFSGSEKVAPSGMAEVSFYFENDEKNLSSQYNSYNEICITRRIFRTGESEYLINKIPCRLTDIVELFLGTGFGTRAYSIIDQNIITTFITSSAEQRRLIVEEAAGITKYRNRKKIATSRLEQTENNLLRISDVIKEIDRQLATIQKQAKKAERYKKLKEELNDIERRRARFELKNILLEERNISEEIDKLRDRENELSINLTEMESRHTNVSTSLMEKEEELNEFNNKILSIEGRIRLLENEKNYFAKEVEHINSTNQEGLNRITKIRSRLSDLEQELQQRQQERTDIENEIAIHSVRISEQEKELSLLTEKRTAIQANLSDIQRHLVETLTEIARLSNQKSYKEATIQENTRKLSNINLEKENMNSQLASYEEAMRNAQEELKKNTAAIETAMRRFATFSERLLDMESSLLHSESVILSKREKITESRSRYNSLVELEKNLEGFDEGIKSLLKARDEKSDEKLSNGIMGVITEFIDVEPAYEQAIESVLGEKLQSLIIKEPEVGLHALNLLKGSSSGRTTFIPLKPKSNSVSTGMPSGPGVIGPAINFIRSSPEAEDISNTLFSDVVIVDNITNAINLWSNNGFSKTLVTPEGDIIEYSGIIIGGKRGKSGGQLARKREIRELKGIIEEFERDLEIEQQRHQALKEEIIRQKGLTDSLKEEIQTLKIQKAELEKDIASYRDHIEKTEVRVETLSLEYERFEKTILETKEEILSIENSIKGLEIKRDELKTLESQTSQEIAQIITEEKIAGERLTNFKIQSAADNQRLNSITGLTNRIHTEQRQLNYEIEIITNSISAGNIKIKELKENIQNRTVELENLLARHREFTESKTDLLNDLNRYSEESTNIEHHLKEIQKEIYSTREVISSKTLLLKETEFKKENIMTYCKDKLNFNIEGDISWGSIQIAEEVGQEDIRRAEELRKIIESFGEINLTAISEFESLTKRREFLQKNYDDLKKAMDNLRKAIARINRISKERFIETFNQINEKLSEVTPILTSGGKASLKLTDENNLLEGGVDIIVNPKGKKILLIDMLSGGEKALIGLSLIFAIYKIKPSPFSVLDEVDAPLDEANTSRFITLIKEFAKQSRFMVITHNKRTMEAANHIYGITMQEPGISKAIPLTIDQIFNEG